MSISYQEAIAYSHNFATAKPDILPMEKEHILGLCKVLEAVGEERDRFERMFANACANLGAVQEALGDDSGTELIGFEAEIVGRMREERDDHEQARTALEEALGQTAAERDALAAHVERIKECKRERDECSGSLQLIWDEALNASIEDCPTTSLARLIAEKQAEALGQLYNERQGEGMVRRGLLLDRAIELREQADTAGEAS